MVARREKGNKEEGDNHSNSGNKGESGTKTKVIT